MTAGLGGFRSKPGVLTRVVGEDVLLAIPERDGVVVLSGTAVSVWRLLDAPRSRDDVVSALTGLFGDPSGRIASDVDALLADLSARGLVEAIGGGVRE